MRNDDDVLTNLALLILKSKLIPTDLEPKAEVLDEWVLTLTAQLLMRGYLSSEQ